MKKPGLLAAALLLGISRLSADVVAPSVPSASISPSSVDITSSGQTITITMRVTDDESGFDFGNVFLYNPAGDFVRSDYFSTDQRTSGTAMDGTYTVTTAVPRYAAPGVWRVDAFVDDLDHNRRDIGPGNPDHFSDPAAMTFTVANSGTVDSTPPVLTSVTSTPESVNTTTADATIAFTIECGDALSGLSYGFIYPKDPAGDLQIDLIRYVSETDLVSGDTHSGVYQTNLTLPQGSAEGDWTFDLYLKDEAGNSSYTAAGGVTVATGPLPPPLATRNFLAQAVDAIGLPWSSSGNGWIMQSIDTHDGIDAAMSRPTDDNGECVFQTTVTGPGTVKFQWRVDSEENADHLSVSLDGSSVSQISGHTEWAEESVAIPGGTHTLTWRYSKNASGSNGDDRGWVDEVRFQTTGDLTLPQFQDLRIEPRSVDLTGGPTDVTFHIDVTDDFNGLAEGRIELFDPSGSQRVSTSFDGLSPAQGNSHAGTYDVTLQVPDDAGFGLWHVEITLTEAVSETTRHYGGAAGEAFPIRAVEFFHAGNPNAADSSEPLVRALEVTPGTVDVSTGSAVATVTLRITDAIAGFSYGNVSVYNPAFGWTGSYSVGGAERISGDAFDGIYQVIVTVPHHGGPGSWSVGCYVSDFNNNDHEYPHNLEFPADVRENFIVTNSGTVDTADPVVTSIDVTPSQINTTSGTAQIQVTVSLLDDVSGLLQGFAYFYDPADQFQSPLFTVLDGNNRISGDELSGTYQFTKTLPQGSAAGQWQVRIFVRDKTGRAKFYGLNAEAYPETGDGFFTITSAPASLYQAFVTTYSLGGNDALLTADPDHDGRNNAMELMLGTNPSSAASSGSGLISTTRDATHLHLDFTVNPALTVTASGGFLELRDGGGGAPLRLTGQTQPGLASSWADVLPVQLSGNTYRVSLPFSSGPKGFIRLRFADP